MPAKKTTRGVNKKKTLPRVIFIVGPTSSGKTGLSLKIAKLFSGEIVNADARQIYKGLTIGTGKPPGRRAKYMGHDAYMVRVPYQYVFEQAGLNPQEYKVDKQDKYPEIPHYLMDFLPPTETMSVAGWRSAALRAIKGIVKRGHLPIVVGGTGLYISALIDNFSIPKVPPNPALRESYEKQPLEKLVNLLLKLDPYAATSVDLKNPRRVIRALEVCTFTGKPFSRLKTKKPPVIEAFQIGFRWSREELNKRIDASILRMMEEGWPEEVRKLHKRGVSWDDPAMTSIGYREMARYLRGDILLEEAVRLAKISTHQYAKRQETWFKRDSRINWVNNDKQGIELVRTWLNSR
ncbi:MAG: tRNA (adenosine(37)-N6)-dimethylallyltransferase MiaA [Patescibacteria group bacterium]